MTLWVCIGTENRGATGIRADGGIFGFAVEPDSGAARQLFAEAGIDNPSYLAVDAAAGTLYAVSEVGDWAECTVSAYRIDPATHGLSYLNKQPTRGSAACHVSLLPGGRVGIANYGLHSDGPDQAICVYPLERDGSLGAPSGSAPHLGPIGPDAARQERNHAHCLLPTLDGRFLLAVDLGLDCVIGYAVAGALSEAFRINLPPGAGPRHLVCHPQGKFIYVLNELRPTVSILAYTGSGLAHVGDVDALPPNTEGPSAGAAIQPSADGRFVYVSIRQKNVISVMAVTEDGGGLELVQTIGSGGAWPRSFTLTPSGGHLLVANQHSDLVAIFSRDAARGTLTATGSSFSVPQPQCIKAVVLAGD